MSSAPILEDLTTIQFRSVEWLTEFGPLSHESVLDYFSLSPFYDRQSTNQMLRMQTQFSLGERITDEAEQLKRFVGIEFAVAHSQPPGVFVIHKRNRVSPNEAHTLAAYYVLNGSIYQSPDLYTILSNRLHTSIYSLNSTLDLVRAKRPSFNPRTGYQWKVVQPQSEDDKLQEAKAAIEGENEKDEKEEKGAAGEASQEPSVPPESKSAEGATTTATSDTKKTNTEPDFNFLLLRALQTTANSIIQAQVPPAAPVTGTTGPPKTRPTSVAASRAMSVLPDVKASPKPEGAHAWTESLPTANSHPHPG